MILDDRDSTSIFSVYTLDTKVYWFHIKKRYPIGSRQFLLFKKKKHTHDRLQCYCEISKLEIQFGARSKTRLSINERSAAMRPTDWSQSGEAESEELTNSRHGAADVDEHAPRKRKPQIQHIYSTQSNLFMMCSTRKGSLFGYIAHSSWCFVVPFQHLKKRNEGKTNKYAHLCATTSRRCKW